MNKSIDFPTLIADSEIYETMLKAYNGNGPLILTSMKVRADQKKALEAMAKRGGYSQASVLRAIIDEFCELHM